MIAREGLPIAKYNDRFKHLFLIGSTGTGKTTFFLNLIKNEAENGIIILDPNGSLAEKAACLIPPERLVFVDKNHPISLNPLTRDYLDYTEIANELMEVVNLAVKEKNPNQQAISVLMAKIIRNALRVFSKDQMTIDYLSKFLEFENMRKAVTDPYWKRFDERVGNILVNREQVESAKRVSARLSLFSETLKLKPFLEGKNELDIPKITREKKVVIFNLSGLDDEMTAFIGCLAANQVKSYYMHPEIVTYEPLFFYCDEYHLFINSSYKRFITDPRKYKISCNFSGHSLFQVESDLAIAMLSCHVLIALGCGYKDAELIAREIRITPEQILDLKKYQAYAGIGKKPHKILCYPPPDIPNNIPKQEVRAPELNFLGNGWVHF